MTFSEEKTGDVLIVGLSGKIDTEGSKELFEKLNALTDQAERNLLLDFSSVSYINSSGMGVLLMVAKKLNGVRGKIILAKVNDQIRQVLRISGLASIIGIYPSRDEALQAFTS